MPAPALGALASCLYRHDAAHALGRQAAPAGGNPHPLQASLAREMEAYLASAEWRGKAGGYAIQGIAGAFVVKLSGSYSAVVGLPLLETAQLLAGDGYPVHFNWLNQSAQSAV